MIVFFFRERNDFIADATGVERAFRKLNGKAREGSGLSEIGVEKRRKKEIFRSDCK